VMAMLGKRGIVGGVNAVASRLAGARAQGEGAA
jgi:hypothetical protein